MEGRLLLQFCLEKELCESNTRLSRERKRLRGNLHGEKMRPKLTFLLIRKRHLRFMQNVKAIPGESQNALVVADIGKERIGKVVRKTCVERRKISLLRDVKMRKLLKK